MRKREKSQRLMQKEEQYLWYGDEWKY